MQKYIISNKTLLIKPIGSNRSRIIEDYITYEINKSVLEIVDESCKFYGSSFLGRCKSTEYLVGIKYKCPIIISEVSKLIFFPTESWRNQDCIWINYDKIKKYYSLKSKAIRLEFLSGKIVDINITNYVFSNQLFKASRLDAIVKSKKY